MRIADSSVAATVRPKLTVLTDGDGCSKPLGANNQKAQSPWLCVGLRAAFSLYSGAVNQQARSHPRLGTLSAGVSPYPSKMMATALFGFIVSGAPGSR
jgi:hypothetical protein